MTASRGTEIARKWFHAELYGDGTEQELASLIDTALAEHSRPAPEGVEECARELANQIDPSRERRLHEGSTDEACGFCAETIETVIPILTALVQKTEQRAPLKWTRPRVVCLCGSTRFADDFNREAERLTLEGAIVVRPEVVTYSQKNDPQHHAPEVKAALDELHCRKIDLADQVFVLNVGGYIGESTRNEIEYAERTAKPVYYLEPIPSPEEE